MHWKWSKNYALCNQLISLCMLVDLTYPINKSSQFLLISYFSVLFNLFFLAISLIFINKDFNQKMAPNYKNLLGSFKDDSDRFLIGYMKEGNTKKNEE